MTFLKTALAIVSIFLISCCSSTKTTGNTSETNNTVSNKMENTKMIEEGYSQGVIVFSNKEGDCEYTIKLDDRKYTYLLDPINLDETYKKDGEKIWVKFAGLRMANRCLNANPVSIVEMKKRTN